MKAIRELIRDRRRAQRGSVLSGVLIITAFIAILSGALTTELSTNFLLSRNLMTKLDNQATVDSAVELALSRMQATPISQGCPSPVTATVNGRTASAAFAACAPTVDSRSPAFIALAQSSAFNVGGVHAVLPSVGLNEYLLGDSSGVLRGLPFGGTSGWNFSLGGAITAPPLAMVDPTGFNDVSILVPSNAPTSNGGCGGQHCVAVLSSDVGSAPSFMCYLPTANVVSMPAEGRSYPRLAFVGDATGNVQAFDATESGGCTLQATASGEPVVAGPFVFLNASKKTASDQVYVVTSDSSGSELEAYNYSVTKTGPTLAFAGSIPLPAPLAVGATIDQSSLPARVAITFAGGRVAVATISSNFTMSVTANVTLPDALAAAPTWCQCPGGASIGIGTRAGALYVLDPSLNVQASLAGGPAIRTPPQSDGVGDWFFGADDGFLYEAQQPAGQTSMVVVGTFGQFDGAVGSGVQVGSCPVGICAYLGSSAGTAYTVQLDARNAIITACISTAPPDCSGDNPRLWASVQVGAAGNLQTVHVEGWSYYSP